MQVNWQVTSRRVAVCVVLALGIPASAAPGTDVTSPRPATGVSRWGEVYGWGNNNTGSLGNGATSRVTRPTPITMPARMRSLAAGRTHTVGLDRRGRLWAWGRNDQGQLGDGTTTIRLHPVRVKLPASVRITAMALGEGHTLALTDRGRVYSWGGNGLGQLGLGAHRSSSTPRLLSKPRRVVAIGAGGYHSVAVTSTGAAYAWGYNSRGQLGDGSQQTRAVPTRVAAPDGVRLVAVAAGDATTAALTSTGRVLTWGDISRGAATTSSPRSQTRPVPVRLPGGVRVRSVDAGSRFVVAVTTIGRVFSWGSNASSQLGRQGVEGPPAVVALPRPVRQVSAGASHVLVLTDRGQVYSWGANRSSQLGDGTTTARSAPRRVTLPTGARAASVAAGELSSFALLVPFSRSTSTSPRPEGPHS